MLCDGRAQNEKWGVASCENSTIRRCSIPYCIGKRVLQFRQLQSRLRHTLWASFFSNLSALCARVWQFGKWSLGRPTCMFPSLSSITILTSAEGIDVTLVSSLSLSPSLRLECVCNNLIRKLFKLPSTMDLKECSDVRALLDNFSWSSLTALIICCLLRKGGSSYDGPHLEVNLSISHCWQQLLD